MDLSIIIPVYNSEKIVQLLTNQIIKSVNDIKSIESYEILLINDCSHDDSWEKIKSLAKTSDIIKGINLSQNIGQHGALMTGFNECKGKVIVTMDDDLQHSPNSIIDILNELNKGFDICYAKYLNRKHPTWKKGVSWLNAIISSFLINKPLSLYLCTFRGIKSDIVKEIIKYKDSRIYVDGLILRITKKISTVPVEHYYRYQGPSNYNLKRLLVLWHDMALGFPIYPIRIATIFVIIIKMSIFILNKIFLLFNKQEKKQYEIIERTYDRDEKV